MKLSKESEFFIYLLERYAEYKKSSADKILNQWEELGLTQFIYDMYEIYHIERLQNAFEDIDKLMAEKREGEVICKNTPKSNRSFKA